MPDQDSSNKRPSAEPDEIVEAVVKAAIDRAIARLQNIRDYAGRPAWNEVVRQEMRTALTAAIPLIRAQAVAEIVAWLRDKPRGLGACYDPVLLADAIERGDHLEV